MSDNLEKNTQLKQASNGGARGHRTLKAALAAGVLTVAVGSVILGSHTMSQHAFAAPATAQTTVPHQAILNSPFSFADLVQHVSPAVVTVVSERGRAAQVSDRFDDNDIPAPFRDLFRQFGQGRGDGQQFRFGPGQGTPRAPQAFRSEARGSGFIIESDGYMVTNNHVIDGASKITVKLPNGAEYQAKVIGTDKDTDVALLKVDGVKDLPTVAFGDDRHLRVGDWVVAVGNPFGLGGTVTAGIVSSIGRDIGNGPYTDYLQIDAPINQGNSGGPTFDLSGKVVGMNTAIYSPSGGSVGIGFAVPASTIQTVVDQLKEHGSVTRGWLGVQIQSLTPDMANSIGVTDAKGAIVANVVDNSPAAKAGLRQGDVILSMNGTNVDDSRDLSRRVALLSAGSRAEFTVMRDGRRQNLTAVITKREAERQASNDRGQGSGPRLSGEPMLGMELAPLNSDARQRFDLDENAKGVVVTSVEPDSDAATKGLQPGDVIVKVGNKDVRSPADVGQYVREAKNAGRDSVLLLVDGMGGEHFLTVRIA